MPDDLPTASTRLNYRLSLQTVAQLGGFSALAAAPAPRHRAPGPRGHRFCYKIPLFRPFAVPICKNPHTPAQLAPTAAPTASPARLRCLRRQRSLGREANPASPFCGAIWSGGHKKTPSSSAALEDPQPV